MALAALIQKAQVTKHSLCHAYRQCSIWLPPIFKGEPKFRVLWLKSSPKLEKCSKFLRAPCKF